MSNVLQEAQQLINQGKKKTAAEKLKGYIEKHPHDHRPWMLLSSIASDKFRAHCLQKASHLAKLAKREQGQGIEEQPTVPIPRRVEPRNQPQNPTSRPTPAGKPAQPIKMEANAIPVDANPVPAVPPSPSKGAKRLTPPTQPPIRAKSKGTAPQIEQNRRLKSLAKEHQRPLAGPHLEKRSAPSRKETISPTKPADAAPSIPSGRPKRGSLWAAVLFVGLLAAAGGLFLLQTPSTTFSLFRGEANAETLPQAVAENGTAASSSQVESGESLTVSDPSLAQEGIASQPENGTSPLNAESGVTHATGAVGNLQEVDFEGEAVSEEIEAVDEAEPEAIMPVATETVMPTASPTPKRIQPKEIASVSEPRGEWTPTPLPTNTPEPTPTIVPTFAASAYDPDVWPVVGENERWVDVNLTNQTLIAYEGKEQVMVTVISSGRAPYYTVTGQFRVYLRYPSQTMDGRRLGFDYVTPGVPHVQYFYKDFALHGAFWHNDFGTPVSHGCVNLPLQDAEWLYNWLDYGSLVNVHY